MHRFFCPLQNISGNKITISDISQIHHLKDVLRLKEGNQVIIFDDRGNEYSCIIERLLFKTVLLMIKNKYKPTPLEKTRITVACAIPKGSRMDEIIDKLTQLGAERIIPLETGRVIVKLDKHKKILRQERWKRIALNASLQSQRYDLPIVEPIENIEGVLSKSIDYDLKLIPTLTGERETLKGVLVKNKAKNILILIGPEGDFTPEEIDLAKKAGFTPVSLGDLVLRVETAATAVTSFIRFSLNSSS